MFDYLDEQERITRANLTGIGIVCGLQVSEGQLNGRSVIRVTRGTGIGSAGYLLTVAEDVILESYRSYTVPADPAYEALYYDNAGVATQYQAWELFRAGIANTTAISDQAGFIADKVVLLFLELKSSALRNCSPNDCNDKGSAIEVNLRYLLFTRADAASIIAASAQSSSFTSYDSLHDRLQLPVLKAPRWDVPNSAPVSSEEVLEGFHRMFSRNALVAETARALTALYNAYQPLIAGDFIMNPFASFESTYAFLDQSTISPERLRFIQNYAGFFSDVIKAYDEVRLEGMHMMCSCVPPEGLFPRHLWLGLVRPDAVSEPGLYRSHFIPSPALDSCAEKAAVVRQLFARLVQLTRVFTLSPPLATGGDDQKLLPQVRVTPDKSGPFPLSEKSIPYYYRQTGPHYLYRLWNASLAGESRSNHNLSYQSDEYQPTAPDFVLNPLRFDLEPYNFLRIEGHLGLNYQAVLTKLLTLRNKYRLPVDIVALLTGIPDTSNEEDAARAQCEFSDLDALYHVRRSGLIAFLGTQLRYFYDIPFPAAKGLLNGRQRPTVKWFADFDTDFLVKPNTLGAYFEVSVWPVASVTPYFGPANPAVNILQFIGNSAEQFKELILAYIIYYIVRFPEVLPESIPDIDIALISERENDLTRVARAIEKRREQLFTDNQPRESIVSWEDLDDRLEAVVYGQYADTIFPVVNEYKERLREVIKKQYLSYFMRQHPGLQHKGGVPTGGTFILVAHGESEVPAKPETPVKGIFIIRGHVVFQKNEPLPGVSILVKGSNAGVKTDAAGNFQLRLRELPATLKVMVHGFSSYEKIIRTEGFHLIDLSEKSKEILQKNERLFYPGEVIADFYLPYLCSSNCSPVQFVLPALPPVFTISLGCTGADGSAAVTIAPAGGTPPHKISTGNGNFQPLQEVIRLAPGTYTLTLQDNAGIVSAPQQLTIPEMLVLDEPSFDCTGDKNEYVAVIRIQGGTPPYRSDKGKIINGNTFFADHLPGDTDIEVTITDSNNCSATAVFNHSCGSELSFSASVGCSNSENMASVEVRASGGKAPYQVQADNEPFVDAGNPLILSTGVHQLVVRDSAGSLTVSQTISIPETLSAGETNFDCSGNERYVAVFDVTGGQAPYQATHGNMQGNTFISEPLPADTDIDIVITDSRGCSLIRSLNHHCASPLGFSIVKSCTSSKGDAVVEITPEGGTAPYTLSTDGSSFNPFTGMVTLTAGNHTLTLRDASGSEVSQDTVIPGFLTASVSSYTCSTDNTTYTALVAISGGTAPYSVAGETISDNSYSAGPIESGQAFTLGITDSAGCRTSLDLMHTCEKPCNLPCGGETMECAYRLWLQPPSSGEQYELYQSLKEVTLIFNDKQIPLPGAADLVNMAAAQLNKNFNKTISECIARLNESVQAGLMATLGDEGANRLTITFRPAPTDPFAVMHIETFVCDTFSLEFNYNYSKPSPVYQMNVRYTNNGGTYKNGAIFTNFGMNGKVSEVPAFGCRTRNLCTGSDFTDICQGTNLVPDFTIEPFRTGLLLTNTSKGDKQIAWIWDIVGTQSSEPFYTGEKVRAQVSKQTGIVYLTVITNKGCFAFTEKQILL